MQRNMVHKIAGTLLAAAVLLTFSGCAQPPDGADGDLFNQWPAMAAPAGWAPAAGMCAESFFHTMVLTAYRPIACDGSHSYETVSVGEFTGSAATLPSPPITRSPELLAAWSDCDKKTTEFLGDDWRNGHLWIGISLPSPGAWDGGARWYMCQIGALNGYNRDHISLTHSLKGELTKESSLRPGCSVLKSDAEWSDQVPCTSPHNREFAGTFVTPLSWDELQDYEHTGSRMHAMCRSLIARFVGVPDDGNMKYRTGTSIQYPVKDNWDAGDHSVRCSIYMGNKKLTRSLKGAGPSGLPIR